VPMTMVISAMSAVPELKTENKCTVGLLSGGGGGSATECCSKVSLVEVSQGFLGSAYSPRVKAVVWATPLQRGMAGRVAGRAKRGQATLRKAATMIRLPSEYRTGCRRKRSKTPWVPGGRRGRRAAAGELRKPRKIHKW
jgi:hypothetical protein